VLQLKVNASLGTTQEALYTRNSGWIKYLYNTDHMYFTFPFWSETKPSYFQLKLHWCSCTMTRRHQDPCS